MSWCNSDDVNIRLRSWNNKGISEDDISGRIDEAQRFLKTKLLGGYGASTVTGWDSTTPPMLADMCAVIAAVYIKQYYIPDYKLSETEKMTFKLVDDIVQGRAEILDSDGATISRGTDRVKFNKQSKNKTFTSGNTGDGSWGEGTLDSLGPSQEEIEGDY